MFEGFSPDTFDFLWGLRMNNNREWFLPHKQQYIDTLYTPMKALAQELFAPLSEKPDTVLKVSRIYRDARLHHPLPYKESLWTCIHPDKQWWAESPCLFFEIRPEGVSYGFCLWQPKASQMEAFRQSIQRCPDDFLRLLASTQKAAGMEITADVYKRPKPAEDPRLTPYFAWKGNISCIREEPPSEALFSTEIRDKALAHFQALCPLYDFFLRFPAQ